MLPEPTVTVKLLNISEYTRQRLDGSFDFECNKARTDLKGYTDGRGIREVNRLVDQYGSKAKKWLKCSGYADVVTMSGNVRRAEIHWYEAHGVGKVEFKVKTWLD